MSHASDATTRRKDSVIAGARPLRPFVLVLALGVSVGLSCAANFVLFGSEFLRASTAWSGELVNGTLVANLVLIAVVVAGVLVGVGGARAPELGLRARTLLPALGGTLAAWGVLNVLALGAVVAAGAPIEWSGVVAADGAALPLLGEVLGQLFGNALYEELLFRGVLLTQCALLFAARGRGGLVLALVVSQAIFALQHVPNRVAFDQWADPAGAALDLLALFVSGLCFSGVFLRTRNLLLAVGLHTLVNVPCLFVSGPQWVHPAGMALVLLVAMLLGPRLVPARTSSASPPAGVLTT
ncbi:MAG: CPBP family intramembrane metalloprotease [Planctomycetes bacterium]|nr:CPBP family intramembrane metalloprotease [Planctomycetota bacterium]